MKASTTCDRQRLNPLDIALRAVDETIRSLAYAGFETQMLIWLAGRVDAQRLQTAIERLARRHPAINSVLVEPSGKSAEPPYWRFQPDIPPEVAEVALADDAPQSVLDWAAREISRVLPLDSHPPMRFALLRRPGGKDVVLIQYSHALMDNGAAPLVVKELDRLAAAESSADISPAYEPANLSGQRLRKLSHSARRAASTAAFELQAHTLRGRAAILGTAQEDRPRKLPLAVAARTLDPEVTRGLEAASIAACGFPSLSMTVLASAFRAIQRLGPESRNAERNYIAGIGLDLGMRRGGGALLQNLLSIVPITARAADLADRAGLIRQLSGQMRERLEKRIDLGILRLAHGFQRRPRHIRWVTDHMLRWCYSLWYGYFGSLDAIRSLCGTPVEHCSYVGPTWAPLGLALLVNQYAGRLHLQMTYDPELTPSPLADEWLSLVCDEVTELTIDRQSGCP